MQEVTTTKTETPVEIIRNSSSRNLNLVPLNKVKIFEDNRATAQGGVSNLNASVPTSDPGFTDFSLTLANGTASTKTYILFDAMGANAAAIGGTLADPDSTSALSVAIVKKYFENHAVLFSGFNYEITTGSSAQFASPFKVAKAALNGATTQTPLTFTGYVRNTQYQNTVQTINQDLLIDSMSALVVDVAANTTVVLTFRVKALYNSL